MQYILPFEVKSPCTNKCVGTGSFKLDTPTFFFPEMAKVKKKVFGRSTSCFTSQNITKFLTNNITLVVLYLSLRIIIKQFNFK